VETKKQRLSATLGANQAIEHDPLGRDLAEIPGVVDGREANVLRPIEIRQL
jgi:hypothetical protein